MTLAGARRAADEARADLRAGRDPVAERRARKAEAAAEARKVEVVAKAAAVTFADVAHQHVARQEAGWRSAKRGAQWVATLATYAFPVIGAKAPADVSTADVLAILSPIWVEKPETASRVRGTIEAVLDAAKALGLRSGENVATWRGGLALLLPKRSKVAVVRHHTAVPWAKAPDLMAALAKVEGVAARVARFAILTAARSGEVRGMVWSEVDLAARVWTVPAGRMKGGKAHRVLLSDAAVAMLTEARGAGDPPAPDALVWPAPRGHGALSDMACTATLRRLRRDDGTAWTDAAGATITLHGCARASFRDWCGDTGEDRELAELCLAHRIGNAVEHAYSRGDRLDRRRPIMEKWGRFLVGEAGAGADKVVPLRRGAGR